MKEIGKQLEQTKKDYNELLSYRQKLQKEIEITTQRILRLEGSISTLQKIQSETKEKDTE